MRYWLTLITISIALAQASWAQLTIRWISQGANLSGQPADSRFPSISADGNSVVFQVGSGITAQVWRAFWNGTNWQITVVPSFWDDDNDGRFDEDPINGTYDDEDSQVDEDPPLLGVHPVISADGNHIAFASTWNYGAGANSKWQVHVLDLLQQRVVPISFLWRDNNGNDGIRDTFEPSNGNCIPVSISADGRIVVFLAQSPNALNIVDADGDGTSDPVNNPPSNWLVLIHDRDADGNGIYDEAGIGATNTSIGNPLDSNGYIPAASVSVSANGRIIAFATPVNPANPDENWRVIVRDWQDGAQVAIPNAFAPALSDDGTYLAYLTPTAALNESNPTYLQSKMNLVVQRIERDPTTGQLTLGSPLSLANLSLSPQPGTADGSAGWGYSDWWGAVTLVTHPTNPNIAYVAFHAWATNLIELQNDLLRDNDGDGRVDEDPIGDGDKNGNPDDDGDGQIDEDPPVNFYQGVPNIFLAQFDFGNDSVQLWQLLPPSASPTPAWSPRALPVSLERNGTVFRLPLAPSLLPAISFVNGNRLAIVFQSLAAFYTGDTNGLWDIYLADVLLP